MQTDARVSTPPESESLTTAEKRRSYVFLTIVAGVSLAADLASKAWAKHNLAGFDPQKLAPKKIEVLKDHIDFIYALNPGGAWSFLRSLPDSLRRPFFLFVSASAIIFIVSIYRRVPQGHGAMRWGLPLALGGAMGNLVDRIRYGQVIDFIDMYITRNGREMHWPTYNVADVAIVIGVSLMVIDMLVPVRRVADVAPQALVPAAVMAQDAGGAALPILVAAEPLERVPAAPSGDVAVDVELDGAAEPLADAPTQPSSERAPPSPRS
jgi:signal peptidase II